MSSEFSSYKPEYNTATEHSSALYIQNRETDLIHHKNFTQESLHRLSSKVDISTVAHTMDNILLRSKFTNALVSRMAYGYRLVFFLNVLF